MTPIAAQMPTAPAFSRGPEPPHFVCSTCGSISDGPWTNPLLVFAKKHLGYRGEVTGGLGLCDGCLENSHGRQAAEQRKVTASVEGIPQEFVGATLANYSKRVDNATAIEAAERFLDPSASHDLFLYGPVGTGKTRLAATLLQMGSAALNCRALFSRTSVLMRRLQDSMHLPETQINLDDWARPRLVALDDVGSEKGSDFTRRTLQTLYDQRRDQGKRTIWTSNLDLDALGEFFEDDRLSSRIAGAAEVVFIGGEDQRAAGFRR